MTDTPAPKQAISEEFILRVNDFIEMANRIERRFDSAHAQLAMLHAFTRYSAHHYRSTVSQDDGENRLAFADYISGLVKNLVLDHLAELSDPVTATVAGPEGAAGNPAGNAAE